MVQMITERQSAGMNENQRDLLSNLVRASDGDEDTGSLTRREVIGSESMGYPLQLEA